MTEIVQPAGWVVEREPLEGAQERVRFAYMDGQAREIVIPVNPRRPSTDAELCKLALVPPPGPVKARPVR